MTTEDVVLEFKEKGNESFKNGKWEEAIEYYTKAIINGEHHKQLAVLYKNRAAAYLKINDFDSALADSTATLFRRSQAYESIGKYEEAYKDAVDLLKSDPNNKTVQPILERLHKITQQRATENAQTSTKVNKMINLAFDLTQPIDKRKSAMNNIVVLAREDVGADLLVKEGIF
uniref:Uncharacterized protein n=1 Tax=Megaselia scalaris TaxID=36166 RepID=T1H3A6_MEGSC